MILALAVLLPVVRAWSAPKGYELLPDSSNFVIASVVVASPGNEFYSNLGHTAIRLECPMYDLDYCFSFLTRDDMLGIVQFFSGKSEGNVDAVETGDYMEPFKEAGRGVEQWELNLTLEEKRKLWELADNNIVNPDSRKFNFVQNNCTSIALELLDKALKKSSGSRFDFVWPEPTNSVDNARNISYATRFSPWMQLLCNLFLGTEGEGRWNNIYRMSPETILPMLKESYIVDKAGERRPALTGKHEMLVEQTVVLTRVWLSPLLLFSILIGVVVVVSLGQWKLHWRRPSRIMDIVLFVLYNVITFILIYMTYQVGLFGKHGNWLLLAFNPIPLIVWIFFRKKSWLREKALYLVYAVVLTLFMGLGGAFLSVMELPVVLLIGIFAVRCWAKYLLAPKGSPAPSKNGKDKKKENDRNVKRNIKIHSLLALMLLAPATLLGAVSVPSQSWMSHVSDNALICNLSIPGAHQSATKGVITSAHCQDLTLGELFDAGVRVFDLRPETANTTVDNDYTKLKLYHGILSLSMTFPEALDQLIAKLDGSGEFVIILIRHEIEGGGESSAANRLASYQSRMKALLNAPRYRPYFVNFRRDLRLGEVRGKILLLSRDDANDKYAGDNLTEVVGGYYGGGLLACPMLYGDMRSADDPGNYFYVQNCYECTQSGDVPNRHTASQVSINDKAEAAKEMLDYMALYRSADNEQCIWFINHTSGVSSTSIISQATPAIVRNVAKVTNRALCDYIAERRYGSEQSYGPNPLGIIMMDFAGVDTSGTAKVCGKELVDAVIANNFTDEMEGFLDGTDDVVFLKNVGTGKYLTPGLNWGTRATLGDHPYPMLITVDRTTNQMTFRFVGARNGDGQGHINNFLGLVPEEGENRFYVDKREVHDDNWTVTEPIWWDVSSTTGEFTISRTTATGHNQGWAGASTVYRDLGWTGSKLDFGVTGANGQWVIVKKSDLYAEIREHTDATNPIDVTGLIRAQKVMSENGNHAYDRAWSHTEWTSMGVSDNYNNIGGVEYSGVPEKVSHSQKIWLPAGTYRLEMDGYYRNGCEGDHERRYLLDPRPENDRPELYAGNASVKLASIFDVDVYAANDLYGNKRTAGDIVTMTIPYNFEHARNGLNNGLYGSNVLFFTLESDGWVEIGVRKSGVTKDDWLVFNAFRLYAYGKTGVDERAFVEASAQYRHLADLLEIFPKWGHEELREAIETARDRIASVKTVGDAANLAGWLDYKAFCAENWGYDDHEYENESPVNGGSYYLYNVARGAWLDGGGRNGTHAVVGRRGICATFEQVGSNWYINTHRNNGDRNEYLGYNSTVDCARTDRFRLVASGDGYQIVRAGNTNVALAPRGGTDEVFADLDAVHHNEALVWKLVSAEQRDRLMESAAGDTEPGKPVEVSYKITAGGFERRAPMTQWVSRYGNGGVSGINDDRRDYAWEFADCGEAELYQTVEGLRPGYYMVGCDAFYRPLDHSGYVKALREDALPEVSGAELFAYGGEFSEAAVGLSSVVPEIGQAIGCARPSQGTPTALGNLPATGVQACEYFRDGLYRVECVKGVEVGEDGKLTLGVRKPAGAAGDWLVADNFRLYYEKDLTGVETITADEQEAGTYEAEYYNLQGVRVTTPTRGIYIRVIGTMAERVVIN